MADQPTPPAEASKGKSWLKTILGGVAGLLGGAVLMYLTPLLDRVVKPAKPLANFGFQAEGLTVTFHNRSMGGSSGWWDFGDGSPLQPVMPEQEIITHTYPRPGEFTVKLSLRNILGEEHDRAVVVKTDTPRTEPPSIASFQVVPESPGSYAPATFRLVSRVQNAQLFIWDLGDDRPLEINGDKETGQEKTVTFDRPGAYVVKLAAVNGTQAAMKSDIVQVNVPPAGAVTAILNVDDQATQITTEKIPTSIIDAFPDGAKDAVHKINKQSPAKPGFDITDVWVMKDGKPFLGMQGKNELAIDPAILGLKNAKDLRLQIAPDRKSVRLTGELVRESSVTKRPGPSQAIAIPIQIVQEKRESAKRAAPPITAMLTVPGSAVLTMPTLPGNWKDCCRQARVELREGDKVVWQESQLSRSALVMLHNKRVIVATSFPNGNQVKIDLVELPPGLCPSPN